MKKYAVIRYEGASQRQLNSWTMKECETLFLKETIYEARKAVRILLGLRRLSMTRWWCTPQHPVPFQEMYYADKYEGGGYIIKDVDPSF